MCLALGPIDRILSNIPGWLSCLSVPVVVVLGHIGIVSDFQLVTTVYMYSKLSSRAPG